MNKRKLAFNMLFAISFLIILWVKTRDLHTEVQE